MQLSHLQQDDAELTEANISDWKVIYYVAVIT